MAELFPTAIIFPIANSIVKKLGNFTSDHLLNYFAGEINAAKSTIDDLKIIAEDLKAICAVLQDAQDKQCTNAAMKLWLRDLKRVVYEIDDLLDDVAIDSLHRSVNKGHCLPRLRYYLSSSNPFISRFDLSHKIKDVRQQLERIVTTKTKFGLTERPVEVSRPERDLFHDISYLSRSSAVGRDGAKDDVMRRLLSCGNAKCPSVLPIVGIGGMGKTTLAKVVYDGIHNEFDMKIWACVTDKFSIIKLLEDIIKDASGENTSNHSKQQLIEKLKKLLCGKKYMLVLDDVWVDNVATWADLMSILEVGKMGSVILVTTRSARVASSIQTMEQYDLDRLSDGTSWSIFSQLAFKEGEQHEYPGLCRIGRSIVEKCRGVPLVVKTLGCLLRSERNEQEWKRINDMDSFRRLPGEYNKVMQQLRISYEQLPSHLKPCFAYCALTGRVTTTELSELYPRLLVYMWNAHGLLQLEHRDDVEVCGYACATQLVSRSLLEHPNIIFNGSIGACKIHDLMHELAEDILGEELSVVTQHDLNVSESTKHIIWGYEGSDGLKGVEFPRDKLLVAKKARTFKFGYPMSDVGRSFLKEVVTNFSYLRTLEIGDSHFEELPRSVGNLKHLRGLKLSFNPLLKTLPDTICNLLNLETLDLYCCEKLEKLPKNIYRLLKLRYFVVTTRQKTFADTKFIRLPSLRFLWIIFCRELESLWEDDDIGRLYSLQRLYIEHCPTLGGLPNSMKGLTALEDLVITHCEQLDLAEGNCLGGLQSLRSLAISQLPLLKCLPDGFQSAAKTLEYFYIANCGSLTGLGHWSECFAVLHKIQIHNCPNLVALPQRFRHLKSLKELIISNCPHLSESCAVPHGVNYPLIQHVPRFLLDSQLHTPPQTQPSSSDPNCFFAFMKSLRGKPHMTSLSLSILCTLSVIVFFLTQA